MSVPTIGFQMHSDGKWSAWVNGKTVEDSPRFEGGDLNGVLEQIKGYLFDQEMHSKIKMEIDYLGRTALNEFKKAHPSYQEFCRIDISVEVLGVPYGFREYFRINKTQKVIVPKVKK